MVADGLAGVQPLSNDCGSWQTFAQYTKDIAQRMSVISQLVRFLP